ARFPAYDRPMIVVLDVGNTNVTMGVVNEGDVTSSRRTPTAKITSAHSLAATLDYLTRADGVELADITELVVSSVVPAVTTALADLAAAHGIALLVADNDTVP